MDENCRSILFVTLFLFRIIVNVFKNDKKEHPMCTYNSLLLVFVSVELVTC